MANSTTLQVGTYNAQTDTFTPVLDLNDGVTFRTQKVDIAATQKVYVQSFNIRYPGAPTQRWQYQNKTWTITLYAMGASTNAIESSIHTLYAAIEDPVANPYVLKYTPAGGTNVTYWPVQRVDHVEPYDALRIQQGFQLGIVLTLDTLPKGFSIPRQYLQNLAWNPGFEAPDGVGTTVFTDAFTSANAYSSLAGSAPTINPANTYVDVVVAQIGAANLLRYFRLGLADDSTHSYDLINNGLYTGTPHNTPTQGVSGGIPGDTDTATTFSSGSSEYIDCPTINLPTGNSPISFGGRVNYPSHPGGNQYLWTYGGSGGGAHNFIGVYMDSSGRLNASVNTGALIVTSSALTTNTWYDWAVKWDGTTLKLYINGASVGTPITPGNQTIPTSSLNFRLAATADASPALHFNGTLDEVWVANTAVSDAAIANIATAGASGASGTLANAMTVPSGARIGFGSPAWGTLQTWSVVFRWVTGLTFTLYTHRTDANNFFAVQLAAGANGLKILHNVAGVTTTVAQATITPLQHEAWYTLILEQFPCQAGSVYQTTAFVGQTLPGVYLKGGVFAQIGGLSVDDVTAATGIPQIATSGAATAIGSVSSGLGNRVKLFGPGAWQFTGSQGSATGVASGAWEGLESRGASTNTSNCYPNGPDTSYGAARIDLPPAGQVDCAWYLYNNTGTTIAPAGTWAMPVVATPATIQASIKVKTSGLGSGCVTRLDVWEYDATGAFLRSFLLASLTGNQTSWQTLAGSGQTGASTAYIGFAVRVVDTTPGASANGTVWLDNCQVWDQTATGMAAMPYCELRFPQSPAQLLVTGILGDAPAPALFAFGTYLSSWGPNSTLVYQVGRRLVPQTGAVLLNVAFDVASPGAAAISNGQYGGYVTSYSGAGSTVYSRLPLIQTEQALRGAWHLLLQFFGLDGTSNDAKIAMNATVNEIWSSFAGYPDPVVAVYANGTLYPVTADGTWLVTDLGFFQIPPYTKTQMVDLTQVLAQPYAKIADPTGGGGSFQVGWIALLPVDGGLVAGTINNPSGSGYTITQDWLFVYADGTGGTSGATPATALSQEIGPTANPAHAYGGPGTATGTYINVNPAADSYLFVDPTTKLTNEAVNQLLGYITDNNGNALAFACDVIYQPQYLYPN